MTTRGRLEQLMASLRERGEPHCVVTVVRTADATSAKAGARAVVTVDGELHGFIGGACVHSAVLRSAREVLDGGEPRMLSVRPPQALEGAQADGIELHPSGCPSGGTVDLFVEAVRRAPMLVVLGDSPVAHALAAQGEALGLGVEQVGAVSADTKLALAVPAPSEADAVVVCTQGRGDAHALRAALMSDAGYVGMVGSRKKVDLLRARLADDIGAERVARLRGPAGLRLGGIEPEEIAVAVAAELVAWRRGAMCAGPTGSCRAACRGGVQPAQ